MTVEDPRLTQIRKLDKDLPPDAMASWQFRKEVRAVLDAPPVDATPPQGIDRDALIELLHGWSPQAMHPFNGALADRILALVRPVEGVVLTPEEAGLALSWWRTHPNAGLFPPADDALAARLEAAQ